MNFLLFSYFVRPPQVIQRSFLKKPASGGRPPRDKRHKAKERAPMLVLREPNTDINPINPLIVPDLDDLIEKEKLHQNEAQEKYELLEERLRVVEGINISEGVDVAELSLV